MAYLQSHRGDYLGSYRGDPGIFGFIKKAVGTVARIGTSFIPGPGGAIARQIVGGRPSRAPQRPGIALPFAGPRGLQQPQIPYCAGLGAAPARRYRRMNPANPKALRRAIRRQESFVKLAKKALQGTKYTIVTRGTRAPRRVNVRESGPGSVTVRG